MQQMNYSAILMLCYQRRVTLNSIIQIMTHEELGKKSTTQAVPSSDCCQEAYKIPFIKDFCHLGMYTLTYKK